MALWTQRWRVAGSVSELPQGTSLRKALNVRSRNWDFILGAVRATEGLM